MKSCPVTKVAQLLSDTWTMLIIYNLFPTTRRFCELEDLLDGISTRTLTLKLLRLEREKLVKKSDRGYTLTAKAKKLASIMDSMERYGKKYL